MSSLALRACITGPTPILNVDGALAGSYADTQQQVGPQRLVGGLDGQYMIR